MPAELLITLAIIIAAVAVVEVPWHVLPWLLDRIDWWYDRRTAARDAKAARP